MWGGCGCLCQSSSTVGSRTTNSTTLLMGPSKAFLMASTASLCLSPFSVLPLTVRICWSVSRPIPVRPALPSGSRKEEKNSTKTKKVSPTWRGFAYRYLPDDHRLLLCVATPVNSNAEFPGHFCDIHRQYPTLESRVPGVRRALYLRWRSRCLVLPLLEDFLSQHFLRLHSFLLDDLGVGFGLRPGLGLPFALE